MCRCGESCLCLNLNYIKKLLLYAEYAIDLEHPLLCEKARPKTVSHDWIYWGQYTYNVGRILGFLNPSIFYYEKLQSIRSWCSVRERFCIGLACRNIYEKSRQRFPHNRGSSQSQFSSSSWPSNAML